MQHDFKTFMALQRLYLQARRASQSFVWQLKPTAYVKLVNGSVYTAAASQMQSIQLAADQLQCRWIF